MLLLPGFQVSSIHVRRENSYFRFRAAQILLLLHVSKRQQDQTKRYSLFFHPQTEVSAA